MTIIIGSQTLQWLFWLSLLIAFAPLIPFALKWGAYGLFGLMFAVIPVLIIGEHVAKGNYGAIVWGVGIAGGIVGLSYGAVWLTNQPFWKRFC